MDAFLHVRMVHGGERSLGQLVERDVDEETEEGDQGADLQQAYGYADSHSDLPMLQAVGRPTAVSPDVTLFREARRARWPIEEWRTAGRAPRLALPSVDTSQAHLPG